jgi:site-specific DNA-cytosine methylase
VNVLSLFDGMSCGQIALDRLGKKVGNYFASEVKPHAIKTTLDNYPNTKQLGDITKIAYENGYLFVFNSREEMNNYFNHNEGEPVEKFHVGKIDLMMGGSPCQNFSQICIPSKRLGLSGDKSKLFYEYLRLLNEIKPKYFLLENVSGMDKEDQEAIDSYLGVKSIRINSELVAAQLRDRLYWTNVEVKELPKDRGILLKDVLESGYSPRKKALCLLEGYSRPTKTPYRKMRRHAKALNTLIFKDEQHYEECMEFYNNHFKGLPAKEADSVAEKLDVSIFDGVRDLSQLEMERLQTVPEGYTKSISRNDAASLLGDGWTVDVIAHILNGIK